MRKFAENKQTIKQTKNSSKTEATLILCESSGERANITNREIILYCMILARSPDDPQRIRVASVFELFFFVCLIVCLFSVGKYSHFSPHPPLFPSFILLSPLLLISKIFAVMNKK